MATDQTNTFGIEELKKGLEEISKKYPQEANKFLNKEGLALKKDVIQLTKKETSKLTGRLLEGWEKKRIKVYKDGTVRVVRVENKAPHSHLIEYGHEIYHGSGRGNKGKSYMTRKQRQAMAKGVKTQAFMFLERAVKAERNHFQQEATKLINKLIKDVEV